MTAAPDLTKGLTDLEARAIAMAREEGATEHDLGRHRLAYKYLRAVLAADATAGAGTIAQGNGE